MGGSDSRVADCIRPRLCVVALALADALALTSAVVVSLVLRFDDTPWPLVEHRYLHMHVPSLLLSLVLYLGVFAAFRLYRQAWRFASLDTLGAVLGANSIGIIGLIVVQTLIDGGTLPRSVLVMVWLAGAVLTGGLRVVLRLVSNARHRGNSEIKETRRNGSLKRAVILGAGTNGARVLRAVCEDASIHYNVIGFLDDDPRKAGIYVSNVRVLGPIEMLRQLLARGAVDEVIVALPKIDGRRLREHVMECRRRRLPVKVVPQVRDMLNGKATVQLEDFSVEDLLRREPVRVSIAEVGAYVKGKRVLVTGAGGSIGSELCRQIMSLRPAELVLLGHGENSIHRIWIELRRDHPDSASRLHYRIASVAHKQRLSQVFEQCEPQVVFHAAAHKHVPMMEVNEQEAIENNVLGTHHVAELCGRMGVERMVLLSTDKAAEPCSIMGATKRVCEEVLRSASALWPDTRYVTVRFGNVLGSRGSVVPIIRDQIRCGGPVSVTHPEMTRYFMTIPEAVTLVLQAGAIGKSGELYLLEMGEPIRILDLATDMIRLCGFEPGVDIHIEFTGIRPGEKLHECLTAPCEDIRKTPWEGLSLVRRPTSLAPAEMWDAVNRLELVAGCGSPAEARKALREIVERSLTQPATWRPPDQQRMPQTFRFRSLEA